jgi:hypothetical protein
MLWGCNLAPSHAGGSVGVMLTLNPSEDHHLRREADGLCGPQFMSRETVAVPNLSPREALGAHFIAR